MLNVVPETYVMLNAVRSTKLKHLRGLWILRLRLRMTVALRMTGVRRRFKCHCEE